MQVQLRTQLVDPSVTTDRCLKSRVSREPSLVLGKKPWLGIVGWRNRPGGAEIAPSSVIGGVLGALAVTPGRFSIRVCCTTNQPRQKK